MRLCFSVPGKIFPAGEQSETRVVKTLSGLKASRAADTAEKFM